MIHRYKADVFIAYHHYTFSFIMAQYIPFTFSKFCLTHLVAERIHGKAFGIHYRSPGISQRIDSSSLHAIAYQFLDIIHHFRSGSLSHQQQHIRQFGQNRQIIRPFLRNTCQEISPYHPNHKRSLFSPTHGSLFEETIVLRFLYIVIHHRLQTSERTVKVSLRFLLLFYVSIVAKINQQILKIIYYIFFLYIQPKGWLISNRCHIIHF